MNSLLLFENAYARLCLLDIIDEYRAYKAVMEYAFYDIRPDYSSMNEKTQRTVHSIIRDINNNRERWLSRYE